MHTYWTQNSTSLKFRSRELVFFYFRVGIRFLIRVSVLVQVKSKTASVRVQRRKQRYGYNVMCPMCSGTQKKRYPALTISLIKSVYFIAYAVQMDGYFLKENNSLAITLSYISESHYTLRYQS